MVKRSGSSPNYGGRDREYNIQLVREHFYKEDDETRCIVLYKDKEIGYIQYYPLDERTKSEYEYSDQEELVYGTDQFIGEVEYWNRGIGKQIVRSMIDYLMKEKKASRIVMDPQTWNTRAIACYERCGLQKVKLLEANEWHEGEFRDCWLMEYKVR